MLSIVGLALLLTASPQFEALCAKGEINTCKSACKTGSDFACIQFAKHQALGDGVAKDVSAAERTLRAQCARAAPKEDAAKYNRALACGVLGSLVGAGKIGDGKDVAAAVGFFETGCTGGDPLSCESLGGIYGGYEKQMKVDYAKALSWYEKGCALRNGRCCQMAGAIHDDGAAGKRDGAKAVEYFTRACAQDLGPACAFLARRYAAGNGVKADPAKATTLEKKACRLGYTRACRGR